MTTSVRRRRTHRLRALLVAVALTVAAGACSSSSPKTRGAESGPEAVADAPDKEKRSAQELFIKGNDYLDRGEWERAIATYEKSIERDDGRWDVYLNKAVAHSANTEFEAALNAVKKSIESGGEERPTLYFNLGNIYQNRGLYRKAIQAYRTSLAMRDDLDVDTLVNIGSALTIIGRHEDAKATYERAERLAPNNPQVKHGFAILLHMNNEEKKAIDAFGQLLSMEPDYAQGYYDRGFLLAQQKKFRRAIDDMERFLELAPDHDLATRAEELIKLYRDELSSKGGDASEADAEKGAPDPPKASSDAAR